MQKLNIYFCQTFSVEVESEPLGVVVAPQHIRIAKVELCIVARDGKGGRSTVRQALARVDASARDTRRRAAGKLQRAQSLSVAGLLISLNRFSF